MDPASYAMSHVHRGKFIIISNKNFASTTQFASRRSADHDVNMLRDAFSRLGFDVIVHRDRTAVQMLAIISQSMNIILHGV